MKRKSASAQAAAVAAADRAGTDLYLVDCRIFGSGNPPTSTDMSDYEFMMSLRIRHPRIDPAEITRVLGIEAQHTWRAGDTRRNPAGDELGGTHRETYWMGRLMPKPSLAQDNVSVESEILHTLGTLRRCFDFLAQLKTEGGSAELHVSLYAREEFRLEFLPEALSLIGRLGLAIALEVKPNPQLLTAAALN
jgi:hypothetical protein